MQTHRLSSLCLLILIILMFTSCVSNSAAQRSTQIPYRIISGTVMYPNNLYFPTRVRMEITLTAQNLSSNEQFQLVTQSIRNPQRFPVNFILRYDPNDISRSLEYSLIVELYHEQEESPYLISPTVVLPTLTGDENILVELAPIKPTINTKVEP
ncbi:MAG: YbaY family lipoprotein [Sphaerochaetaceae bacterium]|nr:YbaY family lipoprotein [Sphaerochaetaceae bacterium]